MDTRIPRILTNCAGHCSLGLGGAVRELLELNRRIENVTILGAQFRGERDSKHVNIHLIPFF
jgi:hypothetical protein